MMTHATAAARLSKSFATIAADTNTTKSKIRL
jgi:hypothetical protein